MCACCQRKFFLSEHLSHFIDLISFDIFSARGMQSILLKSHISVAPLPFRGLKLLYSWSFAVCIFKNMRKDHPFFFFFVLLYMVGIFLSPWEIILLKIRELYFYRIFYSFYLCLQGSGLMQTLTKTSNPLYCQFGCQVQCLLGWYLWAWLFQLSIYVCLCPRPLIFPCFAPAAVSVMVSTFQFTFWYSACILP